MSTPSASITTMSSSSLTSNESTGIDPSTIRDSLEFIRISPARRPIRHFPNLSPAGEDMPISGINTPQRSTLARNNLYKDWFPGFEDSTGAAPPNNPPTSSTGVTTTNTSTGATTSTSDSVTTIITGGGTANTNIPILGPFDALKKAMKNIFQLPINAVKLRIRNGKLKVDALLIKRTAQGLGGVDAATQTTNQIEQDNIVVSATATTTAPLANFYQCQASTMADNNTNGMGDLIADTRNNAKASEHKKVTLADKKVADDNNESKRRRFV